MQRKRRTVNASCLGLYKARSVTCTHTEPPAERGSGRVGDPPPHHTHRRHPPGDSGPVTGNSSLCFLEVLPPTTLSLKTKTKTNQVYIIIKRSCEEALFSFG